MINICKCVAGLMVWLIWLVIPWSLNIKPHYQLPTGSQPWVWSLGCPGNYSLDAMTRESNPYSKVHGANMGPTWVLSTPDAPHVGPMNLAIREAVGHDVMAWKIFLYYWPFVRWEPQVIGPVMESFDRAHSLPYGQEDGFMMTSSDGNIFCITGPLCGEFTGRWIPPTKASDVELWCSLWSTPEQTVE